MKNTKKALKFSILLHLLVTLFLACDKDFSIIESNVLGDKNLNFDTNVDVLQIAAYNKKLEALQINGLSSNLLGVYNDPAYGQTVASIITQLTPASFEPKLGTNPVIDSVVITIPYFNRVTGTTNGNNNYTIQDSLYGKTPNEDTKPFKLTIYQNNYFLRDFDPNGTIDQRQLYYSKADRSINATDNFALNGISTINFDQHKSTIIYTEPTFIPSNKPINTSVTTNGETLTTPSAPAFRAKLDAAFWKTTILDKQDEAVLTSAAEFNNYFRGLYFKAEAVNNEGSMVLLNLSTSTANITIYYTKDSTIEGEERTQDNYVLNFTGNKLNTYINNYNLVTLQDGNQTQGDQKLYLKGTEGSMAVVNLFSGTINYEGENMSALDAFLKKYRLTENGEYKKDSNGNYILKRLINDAQLIIYEDEFMPTHGEDENGDDYHKYDRIYAYDIKNNTQLIDYVIDPTKGNTTSPYNAAIFHLGQRTTNETAISKYKIHLTEYLNDILLRDSTNTKIGLVLSSNVNQINNAAILNPTPEVTNVQATSIITPRGTILHGTNAAVPENRKMTFKVFFSETKQ